MPVLADDDVVVHGDAERGGDVDDGFGNLDVGLRRGRIAQGVIVQQTTVRLAALISASMLTCSDVTERPEADSVHGRLPRRTRNRQDVAHIRCERRAKVLGIVRHRPPLVPLDDITVSQRFSPMSDASEFQPVTAGPEH